MAEKQNNNSTLNSPDLKKQMQEPTKPQAIPLEQNSSTIRQVAEYRAFHDAFLRGSNTYRNDPNDHIYAQELKQAEVEYNKSQEPTKVVGDSKARETGTLNEDKLLSKMEVYELKISDNHKRSELNLNHYTPDDINRYRDALKSSGDIDKKEITVKSYDIATQKEGSINIANGDGVIVFGSRLGYDLKVIDISNPQKIKAIDGYAEEYTFSKEHAVAYNFNNVDFDTKDHVQVNLECFGRIMDVGDELAKEAMPQQLDNIASNMLSGNMIKINSDITATNKDLDLSKIEDKENKIAVVTFSDMKNNHMNDKEFLQGLSQFKDIMIVTNEHDNVEKTLSKTLDRDEQISLTGMKDARQDVAIQKHSEEEKANELSSKIKVLTIDSSVVTNNRIMTNQVYTQDEVNRYRDELKGTEALGKQEIRVKSEQGQSIKIAEGEGVTVTNKDDKVKELKVTDISNPQEIKGIDKDSHEQTFSRNDVVKYNLNNIKFGLENHPEKHAEVSNSIEKVTNQIAKEEIPQHIDNLASQMLSGDMEKINSNIIETNRNLDLYKIEDKENKVAVVTFSDTQNNHMNNKEFVQELNKFKEIVIVTDNKNHVEQAIQNTVHPSELKLNDMTVNDAKALIDTHDQAKNIEYSQEQAKSSEVSKNLEDSHSKDTGHEVEL